MAVDSAPYRLVAEKGEPPRDPPDALSPLGPLRSSHGPAALRRTLAPAIAVVALLVLVGAALAPSVGLVVFAVIFPFALVTFALLAWSPIRMRHIRVALHANGVVVSTSKTRDVIAFDHLDEVWMVLDPVRSPLGTIALIRALRVVGRDGISHRIPTNVTGGVEVGQWVIRHCSNPLRADATRALREGETLKFGKVELDRDGIRGRSWATRWSDLSLVRCAPGRITFFRGQKIIPWRSIRLDRVPHPTIFAKLVTECAPKVEVDDPLGALAK